MFTSTHQPPRHAVIYCRHCGHATETRVPEGDTHPRSVCPDCGTIHYVNPLVVVGTVPVLGDKVLLCKRNIEPRRGKWTLPAGFMELDETTAEGAARETVEEAGASFEMGPLFALMNVPRVGQVHVFYRCELQNDQFAPGIETMEARLFAENEIPWDEIAFLTVRKTLKTWFQDRLEGRTEVHSFDFAVSDFLPDTASHKA